MPVTSPEAAAAISRQKLADGANSTTPSEENPGEKKPTTVTGKKDQQERRELYQLALKFANRYRN